MVRIFVDRRCVAPVTLNDDDYDHVGCNDRDGGSVRTLSYLKLPQSRLCLSVLKLDGSRFDVYVERNATVAELKQAIEEVFTLSPKDGQDKISWKHVWGHFCLCYDGRKLFNDKAQIKDLQIKDGDQLHFIRHMSIDYLHSKRRPKTYSAACPVYSLLSSGSNACEEGKHAVLAVNDNLEVHDVRTTTGSDSHEEKKNGLADEDGLGNQDDSFMYYQQEVYEEIPAPEFKLVHFLRGWLSYSRLGVSRRTSEGKKRPSRFAQRYLGGLSRMITLRS